MNNEIKDTTGPQGSIDLTENLNDNKHNSYLGFQGRMGCQASSYGCQGINGSQGPQIAATPIIIGFGLLALFGLIFGW